MPSFTDRLDRTWTIDLTLGDIERVKAETGHNLSEPGGGEPPLLTRFQVDLAVRGAITWALLRPTAEARGIDLQAFLSGFDGATLRASYEAIVEGLCNFFRLLGRPDAVAWVEKMTAVTDRAAGLTATRIQAQDTATIAQTAMDQAMTNRPRSRKPSSKPATGSPVGSASTPAP